MLSISNITKLFHHFLTYTIEIVLTIFLKKGKECLLLCGQLVWVLSTAEKSSYKFNLVGFETIIKLVILVQPQNLRETEYPSSL